MSIQFDWHDAEDERWAHDNDDRRSTQHDWRPPDAQEQAPTPAARQKAKGRQVASQRTTHWETMRVVRYLGLGVLIGAIISIGVIYAVAQRNRAAARADLQAIITVEANALAAGDAEIFLAFQDDSDAAWQNLQKTQMDQLRRSAISATLTLDDFVLTGDVAWATVRYQQDNVDYQRVQFYRLVDGQWKRTAPDTAYWGEEKTLETPHLRFTYREKDEALIKALSSVAEDFYSRTHLAFNVGASPQLEFYFDPEAQPAQARFNEGRFHLSSPQLTGVRRDGQLPAELVETVAYDISLRLAMEKSGLFLRGRNFANGNWVMLQGVVFWQLQRLAPNNSVTQEMAAQFGKMASQGQFLPISSLWPPFRFGSLERTSAALAESYNVVNYLADSTDPGRIPVLLRALGDGLTASVAFERLGLDLRDFEQQWRSYALAP